MQHCCKTRWILMLRVLPPAFEPALQQIRLQGLFFVGGKTRNSHIQPVLQQCCTFLLLLSVLPHLKTVNRLLCKGSGRTGGRNLLAVFFCSFYTQKHCKRLRNLIKLYQVMFEGYRWAGRPSLRANSRGWGGGEVEVWKECLIPIPVLGELAPKLRWTLQYKYHGEWWRVDLGGVGRGGATCSQWISYPLSGAKNIIASVGES